MQIIRNIHAANFLSGYPRSIAGDDCALVNQHTNHFFNEEGTRYGIYQAIRETYDGPLSMATDLMVWNVTKDNIRVRMAVVEEHTWAPPLARPPVLCPGCPHVSSFMALRAVGARVVGDIGCYTLGFLPLFSGPPMGVGMLTAGLILSLMILPFITAVMRDVLHMVPPIVKEASFGMGSTTWEVTRKVTIPYGFSGLIGAVFLGLGRAVGETMAVLMASGHSINLPTSIFDSVRALTATIAAAHPIADDPEALRESVLRDLEHTVTKTVKGADLVGTRYERLFGYLEGGGRVILVEPEAKLTKASKVPGLDGQKMSKSYDNTISLREDLDDISKKIKTMPWRKIS